MLNNMWLQQMISIQPRTELSKCGLPTILVPSPGPPLGQINSDASRGEREEERHEVGAAGRREVRGERGRGHVADRRTAARLRGSTNNGPIPKSVKPHRHLDTVNFTPDPLTLFTIYSSPSNPSTVLPLVEARSQLYRC